MNSAHSHVMICSLCYRSSWPLWAHFVSQSTQSSRISSAMAVCDSWQSKLRRAATYGDDVESCSSSDANSSDDDDAALVPASTAVQAGGGGKGKELRRSKDRGETYFKAGQGIFSQNGLHVACKLVLYCLDCF